MALISRNEFTADHVPLLSGENTITARATDVSGAFMADSITVQADTSGDYIELTADPVSGMAPFETTLRIDGPFDFAVSDITYTGPGTAEFLESGRDQYRVRLSARGIYTFTATVTDAQGYSYTDSMSVEVVDEAAIDGLLKQKWLGMKAALNSGDIEGALTFIADGGREMYAYNFELLRPYLPEISAGLNNITLVNIIDGEAKYYMVGEQGGQTYSFYVLFIKGPDGIWRIRFF